MCIFHKVVLKDESKRKLRQKRSELCVKDYRLQMQLKKPTFSD